MKRKIILYFVLIYISLMRNGSPSDEFNNSTVVKYEDRESTSLIESRYFYRKIGKLLLY